MTERRDWSPWLWNAVGAFLAYAMIQWPPWGLALFCAFVLWAIWWGGIP